MYQPKRQSAAMMALLVFVFSVFPSKRSEAVVPLVGLAVAALGPSGTVVSADLLVSGVTALIGGSIMALAVTPSTADAPMRVPLVSDQPTIDAAMPPPVVPATVASSPTVMYYGPGGAYSYPSAAASCAAGYGPQGATCQDCNASGCSVYLDGNYQTFYSPPWIEVSGCPTGYSASGGACGVTAPRAVAADSKYDVPAPVGAGGFAAPSVAQEADSMPAYASFAGGKVYAQGKNSSGQPVVIEYAKNADGTKTYITHYTQTETSGQTEVKTQSVVVDAATGAVTSAGAQTAVGSIAPATGAGTVPAVTTGAAVTTGTSSSPIVFPSDYARAGEAASAANTVKTSVDQLKDKFTNSETVDDPTVPDWADHWGATFNPLKAWTMPGHASQCPVAGFGWNGVTYTIDSHCQLITDHWSALQTASVVVWVISALWILLGA